MGFAGIQDWNPDVASRTLSRKQIAYILTRFSFEDKTLTTLVQWCVAAGVQPLARLHGCCDRSEGEHLPHQTRPPPQQSGRCRSRCTCSRTAGKGSDVQEVCVQGRVFAVTANVASQSRLKRTSSTFLARCVPVFV